MPEMYQKRMIKIVTKIPINLGLQADAKNILTVTNQKYQVLTDMVLKEYLLTLSKESFVKHIIENVDGYIL